MAGMKKYLNLRIRNYYGIELLGQSQESLNWELVGMFISKSELIDYVIKNMHQLLKENSGATMYDLNSYGLNDILNRTDDEILYYYIIGGH